MDVWLAKTIELMAASAGRAAPAPGCLARISPRRHKRSRRLAAGAGIHRRAVTELRLSRDGTGGARVSRTASPHAAAHRGQSRPHHDARPPACGDDRRDPRRFVGLSGTVWGIMNSFIGISKSQTTNLAVVAPGIAEALLATAIGLVAAISGGRHLQRVSAPDRVLPRALADASAEVLRLVGRDLDARPRPQPASRRGMTLSAAE